MMLVIGQLGHVNLQGLTLLHIKMVEVTEKEDVKISKSKIIELRELLHYVLIFRSGRKLEMEVNIRMEYYSGGLVWGEGFPFRVKCEMYACRCALVQDIYMGWKRW